MGLDLVVEGSAKPGHEAEWRDILARSFAEKESEADAERFREISIPPFERLGAPRVGSDPAADAWIVKARKAETPESVAATLEEFDGYHVLRLIESDGIPRYSNGGLYEGTDETSFRGELLNACSGVLDKILREEAWNHKMPEEAVAYGRRLLAAASTTTPRAAPPAGLLARLGLTKKAAGTLPFEEQLEVVRSAGKWHVFWGERGHAIRAWF